MVYIWVIGLQKTRPQVFVFRRTHTWAHIAQELSNDAEFNSLEAWDPYNGDYLIHVGKPINSGQTLMRCFTFKAVKGPYEPEAEHTPPPRETAERGVGTHEPMYQNVNNTYLIYDNTDLGHDGVEQPAEEGDTTDPPMVGGTRLHFLNGHLVLFPHWFATKIQRSFRRFLRDRLGRDIGQALGAQMLRYAITGSSSSSGALSRSIEDANLLLDLDMLASSSSASSEGHHV